MASLNRTQMRECPECGKVHDCAFYVEMQVLSAKLEKKMDELIDYVNRVDETIKDIPELEDK